MAAQIPDAPIAENTTPRPEPKARTENTAPPPEPKASATKTPGDEGKPQALVDAMIDAQADILKTINDTLYGNDDDKKEEQNQSNQVDKLDMKSIETSPMSEAPSAGGDLMAAMDAPGAAAGAAGEGAGATASYTAAAGAETAAASAEVAAEVAAVAAEVAAEVAVVTAEIIAAPVGL